MLYSKTRAFYLQERVCTSGTWRKQRHKLFHRTSGIAQQVKTLPTKADNLSSILKSHLAEWEIWAVFWPARAWCTRVHILIHVHTHTHMHGHTKFCFSFPPKIKSHVCLFGAGRICMLSALWLLERKGILNAPVEERTGQVGIITGF